MELGIRNLELGVQLIAKVIVARLLRRLQAWVIVNGMKESMLEPVCCRKIAEIFEYFIRFGIVILS